MRMESQNFGDTPTILFRLTTTKTLNFPGRRNRNTPNSQYVFVLKELLHCVLPRGLQLTPRSSVSKYVLSETANETVFYDSQNNNTLVPLSDDVPDLLTELAICIQHLRIPGSKIYLLVSLPPGSTGSHTDLYNLGRCIQRSKAVSAIRTMEPIRVYFVQNIRQWQHSFDIALQDFLFPPSGAPVTDPVYIVLWQQWLTYDDGQHIVKTLMDNFKHIWGFERFARIWDERTADDDRRKFVQQMLDFMILSIQSPTLFAIFGCTSIARSTQQNQVEFTDEVLKYIKDDTAVPADSAQPAHAAPSDMPGPSADSAETIITKLKEWCWKIDAPTEDGKPHWWRKFLLQYLNVPNCVNDAYVRIWQSLESVRRNGRRKSDRIEQGAAVMSTMTPWSRQLLSEVARVWNGHAAGGEHTVLRPRIHPERLQLADFLCLLRPELGAL